MNTTKSLQWVSSTVATGTEVWNELKTPWQESGTIIAQPGYTWVTLWQAGKPYIITKFLDDRGNLVGIYCDIARPVELTDGGFKFDDLYLDVWQTPNGRPVILDVEDLNDAVEAGHLTVEEAGEAMKVAKKLCSELEHNADKLLQF